EDVLPSSGGYVASPARRFCFSIAVSGVLTQCAGASLAQPAFPFGFPYGRRAGQSPYAPWHQIVRCPCAASDVLSLDATNAGSSRHNVPDLTQTGLVHRLPRHCGAAKHILQNCRNGGNETP